MKISKYKIINEEPITIWIDNNKKEFESPHLLRADKIEFINNHLMFYLGKELIFKVWLKEGEWQKYKDIKEALEEAGIKVI